MHRRIVWFIVACSLALTGCSALTLPQIPGLPTGGPTSSLPEGVVLRDEPAPSVTAANATCVPTRSAGSGTSSPWVSPSAGATRRARSARTN